MLDLVVGTIAGTPLGVWGLSALPPSVLNRLIGLMLVVAFVLETRGLYPQKLEGRRWGIGAGVLAGTIGGAVGLPGPPAVLYAATQGWSARAVKANLQAFFVVNQGAILVGYWWAGLLTREVWKLTLGFAAPALAGAVAGALLFERVDQRRFRQLVFVMIGVDREPVLGAVAARFRVAPDAGPRLVRQALDQRRGARAHGLDHGQRGLDRPVVIAEDLRPVVLIVALDGRALLGDEEPDAPEGVGLGVGAVNADLVGRPLLRRRPPLQGLRRHRGERRLEASGTF